MGIAMMSIAVSAGQGDPRKVDVRVPAGAVVRQEGLTDTERNFSTLMHLSPLAAVVFGPLIITPLILWLVRKDESAFNDDHGREVLNAVLSFVIYHVVLVITVIGMVALPVLWIVAMINVIRAAVAARRGEYFRYPLTIRFLS